MCIGKCVYKRYSESNSRNGLRRSIFEDDQEVAAPWIAVSEKPMRVNLLNENWAGNRSCYLFFISIGEMSVLTFGSVAFGAAIATAFRPATSALAP